MKRFAPLVVLGLVAFGLNAATTIDLNGAGYNNCGSATGGSAGACGTGQNTAAIGGAFIVQQISPQSTGTGVIDSFLRVDANTNEQGYNTSNGTPYDDKAGNFTRALSLSEVPTVTIGTTVYRQFLLDVNQNTNSLISLNQIQIFQASGDPACPGNPNNNCGTSVSGTYPVLSGLDSNVSPTTVFQMSAASNTASQFSITLNYALNAGSGSGDMFLYVPNSDFNQSVSNVVLYTQFGNPPGTNPTNDGFEEWAVLKAAGSTCVSGDCTSNVPEPGSILLFGTILFGVTRVIRKRYSMSLG